MKPLYEILFRRGIHINEDGYVLMRGSTDREILFRLSQRACQMVSEYGYVCFTPITLIERKNGYYFYGRPLNGFYAFDPDGEVASRHYPQQGPGVAMRSGGIGRPNGRNPNR